MNGFARFYMQGGGYMHVVTLFSLFALWASLAHARAVRQSPSGGERSEGLARLASRLRRLSLGVGAMGTLFGFASALALAAQLGGPGASTASLSPATLGSIALHPLIWSLLTCGVSFLVETVAPLTFGARGVATHVVAVD